MKNLFLLLTSLFLFGLIATAQCPDDNTFYTTATPPGIPGSTTIPCIYGGEYVTVDVVAGMEYTFTTCGNTAFDTQLTLLTTTGGFLAYNDDDCGAQSTIVWTATFTGTVQLLVDEYGFPFDCNSNTTCMDLTVSVTPPIATGSGCNTNTTICTSGVAGPFGFGSPGPAVSSCLDWLSTSTFAYITLYITQSGPLDLSILGNTASGFLDVAIFNVPAGMDPCVASLDVNNEIACSYATTSSGCNQIGTTFPCGSSTTAPIVSAGDVIFIVVENWDATATAGNPTNFTLELAPPPSAQTGPPDPTITPVPTLCDTDAPIQMTAADNGGTWSGTGVTASGVFDPAAAGPGTYTINYDIGSAPCDASDQTTVTVVPCTSCNMDSLYASLSACQTGSVFTIDGVFTYSGNPGTGTVIVEATNSSGTYTQTFNPPFVDGQIYNYSISNIPADGTPVTVTVSFSADPSCSITLTSTSPVACDCNADIGTFSTSTTGTQSGNDFTLCWGDTYSINTNNDWTPADEQFNPPGPTYDPGIGYMVYSCPPTYGLNAATVTTDSLHLDPCLEFYIPGNSMTDFNDMFYLNAATGNGGSLPSNNTLYFVPVTFYSLSNGTYSFVNTSAPCYATGPIFSVQYLPEVLETTVEDCQAGTVSTIVSGGLPGVDGSNFTVQNVLPATATVNTGSVPDGGTIVIGGLVDGDVYSYDIVDGNGCAVTISGTFVGVEDPSFSYSQAAYCIDDADPTPTITGDAGGTFTSTAGLSINGSTGTINLGASTPGTYTVTYTTPDPVCFASTTFDVTINPLPIVDGNDETICLGEQVTLNGTGAVSYTWNNGVTDGVPFSPTSTTTYTVTGTDANGCSNTGTATVTVTPLDDASFTLSDYCVGGNSAPAVVTGLAGGTFAFNPVPTDGATINSSTGVVSNGVAGTTYTIEYTTNGPCPQTSSQTITVNPLPTVVANDVSVCVGGSVSITATGAISYVWDNGLGAGQTQNVSPAVTTTYTVTGTDANGCVNTDAMTVTVLSNAPINAGPDVTICSGASTTITASGGTTYTWDNGLGAGASHTVSPTSTTTYTVNGTDANGCTGTDQVVVTVNPLPTVNAGPDQSVCEGVQVTLSGSGATSYSWDNGVTDGVAFNPPVGTTTTYTVTGTDANGCINTDQVDVTVNALPTVSAGTDQTVCDGVQVTLSGSGANSYSWNNGVTNGVAFSAPVGTTTYTVTGTDVNGCINTDQVDVTVNPLPIVDGNDETVCLGEQVTLNGTGAVSYTWNNGVIDGTPFTPAATTTYTVTGTDANGCQNTGTATVIVNPLPAVNAGTDQTVCEGVQVTLTGSGATSYSWDNGVIDGVAFNAPIGTTTTYTVTGTDANGCVNTDQVNVTVNPLPVVNAGVDQTVCEGVQVTLSGSGATSYSWDNGVTDGVAFNPPVGATTTYTVIGTDANGCTNTDQVDVTVNPLPVVNAGVDQIVCEGTSITLSGSGASTYVWDNGVTDGVAFTQGVSTVVYTVTGTDINGCINTDQVSVTVNPNPTPVINGATSYCTGSNTTLSTTNTYTTYNWTTGAITPTATVTIADNPISVTVTNSFGCSGTSATFTVSENSVINYNSSIEICQGGSAIIHGNTETVAGTYSQTFVLPTGCDSVSNVTLIVNPLPNVNGGVDQIVCDGVATTLSASGAATLVWDNGVTNGVAFNQAVGTFTYTVTGTDINGCVNTDQVDITVNPLPAVNAGLDQTVCDGVQVTLSGSGAQTYAWNNGVTDGVPFNAPTGATTTYVVTGTDANGCVNTDQVDVTVNPLPAVNAGLDQTVCDGVQVTLSGSGAQTYAWDNGVLDGVPFNAPIGTTTYTVTGTDANGCVNTDQVDVTVNALPVVDGNDEVICSGDQVVLNGTGAVSYTWSNGVIDGVAFTPTSTTTYTVTGTDANGCSNTGDAIVTVNALPNVNAGSDQIVCEGVQLTLAGSGATSYSWNNGVVDGVAFNAPIGATTTYVVTGTDANGCVNTDQVDVTVNPLPNVSAGLDQTVCEGVQVVLSGSGAQSYSWDNGVVDGVAFNAPIGTTTYTVTGTDANGCTNTDQVDVTVNPLPAVNAGADQTVCDGVQVTLSGSGANSYSWDNGVVDGVAFNAPIGTTTYTVTGTDVNGCINTDQVDVTVNPLPIINAGSDQIVCVGVQVTLNGTGGNSYTWSNGVIDGVAFNAPIGTTTYTVTGTDVNGCSNTDQVDVTVNPLPNVIAGNDFVVCEGNQAILTGSGALYYSWDNGVLDGVAFTPSGTMTYTVTGTDANGCENTDDVTVTVEPLPVVSFSGDNLSGCEPLNVTFTNTTPGLLTDCIWTFGNGVTLTGCGTVSTTFNSPGLYDVTLTTTSANGCVNSATYTDYIYVEATPIASFIPSETSLTNFDTEVDFENTSIGASTYNWDFGDGTANSNVVSPSHVFPADESNSYLVELIAYSELGCSDTAYATIEVSEEVIFYVPNTFTPDSDDYNEVFQPVFSSGYDPYDFTLLIFNRWGEILFESHNADIGWDGTYGGQLVQDGTYTWKIEFKTTATDERRVVHGHVNVLK